MKIAYIGIDLFYPVLMALEKNGCEIAKIFTCKTDNITEFNVEIIDYAKKNNIPYTMDRITKEDIQELLDVGVEAIICAGYYYLIPVMKEMPMVNIHPTLLPIGRGSWPMPRIIKEKHKKSGVTMHKIEKDFDTGDIILQKEFILDKEETHSTYMNKVYELCNEMVEELILDFNNLYQEAKEQSEGEYWEIPDELEYTVTRDMSIEEADLILRAFYGYECIYKAVDKKEKVMSGRAVRYKKNIDEYIYLPIKDGYIEIDR
ncbi:MAG: hypothetical protein IJA34_13965 [Lachnospiraceae bacterium]|nr:hypothetical protein [Lachnospiraceae bacterium]